MTSIDCTARPRRRDSSRRATLLVGDRLVVDRELRLRMIADRMEEAVRVGDDTGERRA